MFTARRASFRQRFRKAVYDLNHLLRRIELRMPTKSKLGISTWGLTIASAKAASFALTQQYRHDNFAAI
jgi:hypothetical protein